MSTRRSILLLFAPALLCGLCWLLAALISEQQTVGYACGAILRSLPPLLMAAWPLWGAVLWKVGGLRWQLAAVGLLGVAFMGWPPRAEPGRQPDEHVVVVANVNAYTGNEAALEAALAALGADAVITVEQRGHRIAGMTRVADNLDQPLPRPSFGSAAYCRDVSRCAASVSPLVGSETMAMPIVLLRIAESCVLGLHAPPAYPYDATGIQPYVSTLIDMTENGVLRHDQGACRQGDPVVLAGDLNAVPGSLAYRRLRNAGFVDLRRGVGVYGLTWPTGGGWPSVPLMRLDHVFVGAAEVRLLKTVRLPDTDHKALLLAISPAR